ncbi:MULTISPECIES: malate:quinone oxidoreductase [unclassified Prochlorococcus]|uniref:malate:quinone oxidoreductase n=1 Tax=unclassified Prochlorococcus TaxID=2627481 RepID=UPI00053370E6|nr:MULTISPECIES: malate:quinone oxidoreductase [unclassified Prochlorococcus]KGG16542.1 Malate:quinone oxidoreductase [Prochlorococcus sp. MIT 0602]KGG16983.1 Malate:quinone oxidoreductase [Prochlorococcus sp. MIT 0603]
MISSDALGSEARFDAVLVGAGIMSATLAVLLHELEPEMRILIIERLESPALESSAALNNSGTGHAANCEFNYTPLNSDGSLNIDKALAINSSFERSLEFWASLTEMGKLSPESFLHLLPHVSCVWSEENIAFLRQRYSKLVSQPQFSDMEWSEDSGELKEWIPLMMNGRDPQQKVAATRVKRGTDIDFGALTTTYIEMLEQTDSVKIEVSTEVVDIQRHDNQIWQLSLSKNGSEYCVKAPFVFLGAGGAALALLQKSKIPEGREYGGFPVSGQWLLCNNPELTQTHNAKVYGKSAIGAPPMSVPHLDTRWIKGERSLLFGPFAGFNTKFLKYGSKFDFFRSIKLTNLTPMIQSGIKNIDLIKYLFSQIQLNHSSRIDLLSSFFPNVRSEDWTLSVAGQRVQIIKMTNQGGELKMGTEVVTSSDGSLAALLGASPGASTAVSIMLEVLERCWKDQLCSDLWQERLKKLLPSFRKDINSDKNLLNRLRHRSNSLLGL